MWKCKITKEKKIGGPGNHQSPRISVLMGITWEVLEVNNTKILT